VTKIRGVVTPAEIAQLMGKHCGNLRQTPLRAGRASRDRKTGMTSCLHHQFNPWNSSFLTAHPISFPTQGASWRQGSAPHDLWTSSPLHLRHRRL